MNLEVDTRQLEIVVCATVIDKPELMDDLNITHEDFSDESTGLVYRTVTWLREKGKPISAFTVAEKLNKRVDKGTLVDCCNIANANHWAIDEHARIIRDSSVRRRIVAAGQKLIQLAQESETVDEALAEMERVTQSAVNETSIESGPESISDIMQRHLVELEYRYKNRGKLTGVDTGYAKLNYWFGGWRATDFCVIAARPAMGKTAFMLQTAEHGARDDYVIVFSVEMSKLSLADRLVSATSMVPLFNVRNGNIKDNQWTLISSGYAEFDNKTLFVDDNPSVTVPYMRKQVRRIKRIMPHRKKLAVFVDYLQLIKATGRSRFEEVSEVSRDLKRMAKELDCCVIALAQVKRDVDERKDKRPIPSDLKESGQIEQDADIIAFLYRDEAYNPQTDRPGITEIIVSKNRNGPQGVAEIKFEKEYQKFIDLDVERRNDE